MRGIDWKGLTNEFPKDDRDDATRAAPIRVTNLMNWFNDGHRILTDLEKGTASPGLTPKKLTHYLFIQALFKAAQDHAQHLRRIDALMGISKDGNGSNLRKPVVAVKEHLCAIWELAVFFREVKRYGAQIAKDNDGKLPVLNKYSLEYWTDKLTAARQSRSLKP